MNWKKSTAIFGLSACLLTMVVPAMAAEDIKAAMPPAAQHEKFGAERNILATMLMNGTISEDTYTAIEEYFKQNPPKRPDGEADFEGQEPPAKPDGEADFEGQEPPAKPDGEADFDRQEPSANPDDKADFNGRRPPQGGMLNADMLQALLDVNVITTDEYNTLLAALPTPPKD